MKPLWVNRAATITQGILSGYVGRVVAFDSEKDKATVELDKDTHVVVSSEHLHQSEE